MSAAQEQTALVVEAKKEEKKMNAISKPATRSKLKAVAPKAAEPSKPKILIYGKPGVGKTWASLDFPSVYYIDTEGGANLNHYTDKLERSGGMYLGPEQGAVSFDVIIEQVMALATEKHHFKTLVIDSISKAFSNEIAREGQRLADDNKKNEYGADKKPAVQYMRKLVSWLTRLDMNVVLIAHQKDEYGFNAKGEREVIAETFDCWDRLEYELHLCLHIKKAGAGRKASVRKSRLVGFPESATFDWSYAEFSERYGKDIIEKEVKQVVIATPEQVSELRRMLDIIKMPEGWEAAALKKADVVSWEEIDSDKIDAIIAMLKEKAQ